MNIVIIQPPLVQLNTPYPAGAYLAAYFRHTGRFKNVSWLDLSTELFHELFCPAGLKRLFHLSAAAALARADDAERNGGDDTAFQLRRYISESGAWCSWIGRIVSMVCRNTDGGKTVSGHEWVHEFARSPHVPHGMRMEQFLSSLNREAGPDDARLLASFALADLADYITAVFDGNFSLVRYAEHIAESTASFDDVLSALDAPVLKEFYQPMLDRKLDELALSGSTFFCISVPFPGTFAAAVCTARNLKRRYGTAAVTAIGGGYINTELRNVRELQLFDYIDCISYDRGYGSFQDLFNTINSPTAETVKRLLDGRQFYRLKYRSENKIIEPRWADPVREKQENELTRYLVPDYAGIDFSRSPRLADDTNPMHRIWTDGAWIKAYLAYGCYWHRCAFCDTTLEYVYGYCKTDIGHLYRGLRGQAEKTGVYGIHFVDEACPPVALQEFALANCAADRPENGQYKLTFWGNIRFEKSFTKDLADLLSYGGMTGVSAGIEIATGAGLHAVNKGTDMEHIVGACAAFREAGILVHAYMIYGFPEQTAQDLIDSLETLRQLFAAGLLDSAFWHKFVLTRHSTVFAEWKKGRHQNLKPLETGRKSFAENDIRFAGESKSAKYGNGLTDAVENWMHGRMLEKPVQNWFPFRMPHPTISKNFVGSMITAYEQRRDSAFAYIPRPEDKTRYVWFGGQPIVLRSGTKGKQLCWEYKGNLLYDDAAASKAEQIADRLQQIRPESGTSGDGYELAALLGNELFTDLRGRGLCRLV